MRVGRILVGLAAASAALASSSPVLQRLAAPIYVPDPIFCPTAYEPVCGSNKLTYYNACTAKQYGITDVTKGECPQDVDLSTCSCSWDYSPVCSRGFVTYRNECFAKCAKVELFSYMACPVATVGPVDPSKIHPCQRDCMNKDISPVCGSDGQSYINSCSATCRGVDVASRGECPLQVVPMPKSSTPKPETKAPRTTAPPETKSSIYVADPIFCPTAYEPVCGSNKVTYYNACTAKQYGITDVSNGECPEDADLSKCSCSWDYSPVCSHGFVTYRNECFARCAKVELFSYMACPQATVGPVDPSKIHPCQRNCMNKDISPVCGSDGQSYMNTCSATCRGVSVVSQGECSIQTVPETRTMSPHPQPGTPVPSETETPIYSSIADCIFQVGNPFACWWLFL